MTLTKEIAGEIWTRRLREMTEEEFIDLARQAAPGLLTYQQRKEFGITDYRPLLTGDYRPYDWYRHGRAARARIGSRRWVINATGRIERAIATETVPKQRRPVA
jgi:hypothetical protein